MSKKRHDRWNYCSSSGKMLPNQSRRTRRTDFGRLLRNGGEPIELVFSSGYRIIFDEVATFGEKEWKSISSLCDNIFASDWEEWLENGG